IGGGKITGGNNIGNGGAFFVERGSLYIEGGEISGNKAANGAGIYWESRNNLYIYGGKITENTASANGGGVYLTDWGNVYVGGSIVVDGNICGTKSENVYLSDANIFLKYAGGQNGSVPFTDGAKIGLTCHEVVHYVQFTNADSGFGADCFQYFAADDDIYFIDNVYDDVTGAYNLSVAYDQDGCMYVKTQDSEKRFSDLGKGWVYALKMSMETPTTIKLESDWTPCTDKGFCYLDEGGSEYGTDEGRLYLNNSNINLTIDLNGHSISRSLAAPVKNGQVFCMSAGTLTIIDTSESKNGKITGGNSSYYGGGFYAYGGTIYLKSGNITENTAYCGGGFYIDEAELFLEGGSVSNNTADRGGGIYVNDTTLTIEDGEVNRNHAGLNGGGVYGYDKSIVYMKGGTVANNECEADGGGFYFGMAAGSMNMTGGTIVRNKAAYDGGGIFWNCNGILALTGGVITENHADMGYNSINWNTNGGGGVYASHSRYGLTPIGSDPYIGGNIQIYNNTSCISKSILPSWNNANIVESNMFLDENLITVKQALGQAEGV
ncbi:MAG: hypothetical protein II306_08510, partial [Clostridia bacterium]|nr:hypothetical protein [Clostridia bacterium]